MIFLGILVLLAAIWVMNSHTQQATAAMQQAPPGDVGCLLAGTLWILIPGVLALIIILSMAGQI